MGAVCSAKKTEIKVAIPFPSHLEDFVTFGEVNIDKCLEYVKAVAATEVRTKAGINQLMGPYLIQGRRGCGIRDMTIAEPAVEALAIHKEYTARKVAKKLEAEDRRKGYKVTAAKRLELSAIDVELERRIRCMLLMMYPVFKASNMKFEGGLDVESINKIVRVPLSYKRISIIARLFEKLNVTSDGYLTLFQLGEWVADECASVTQSVFFPLITKIINCREEWTMTCKEFVLIMHNLCTMNEEELIRHVFNSMASAVDSHGEKYIDVRTLKDKFPVLKVAKEKLQLENMSFLKEVHTLLSARAKAMDEGVYAKQGHMIRLADFLEMKRRSKFIMYSVSFTRTFARKVLFGARFWNKRGHALRLREGHKLQDPTRRGSNAIEFYETLRCSANPTKAIKLPYRVKPLGIEDLRVQKYTKASHDYRRRASDTYTRRGTAVQEASRSNRRASAPSMSSRNLHRDVPSDKMGGVAIPGTAGKRGSQGSTGMASGGARASKRRSNASRASLGSVSVKSKRVSLPGAVGS